MHPNDAVGRLLRAAAWVECEGAALAAMHEACGEQRNWREVIRQAELHGLAPILSERIDESGADTPPEVRRQLKGLVLRHEQSNRIRTRALLEILEAFEARDIDVLVLKGAALAHLLYDRPGLRPMSDIDLLVARERLDDASHTLREMDYFEAKTGDVLADHHHLPTMSRETDGLLVSVEIHHEAIAVDNIGSIRMDSLSEPSRGFAIEGTVAHTLGHGDMLRHLCRHALEPRETIKIGSALDILLYASRFAERIDWSRLGVRYPGVITSLQLFSYLIGWPRALDGYLPEPPQPAPEGVGVGIAPLSALRHRPDRLSRLLSPPDWWLHAFYNVPPGRSLVFTRVVRHPVRLAFWLWRRMGKTMS